MKSVVGVADVDVVAVLDEAVAVALLLGRLLLQDDRNGTVLGPLRAAGLRQLEGHRAARRVASEPDPRCVSSLVVGDRRQRHHLGGARDAQRRRRLPSRVAVRAVGGAAARHVEAVGARLTRHAAECATELLAEVA